MKIIKQLTFLSPTLLFSLNANANQINSSGLLDNLLDKYQQVASTWTTVLGDYANWLFWGLVLISMVWTFGMIAMKGGGFQDLLAEVVRFFAINGFFFFILKNGPAISKSIIDSLRELAGNALGTGNGISPSSIVDMAFVILTKVSSAASIWSPMISTIMITVAIIVLVVMSLIAVNMLIMLVSAWVMCYAGIILLGFGGSKLTSDITVNYLRTVLSVGIQLFVMTLIIGIGQSFIDQYFSIIKDDVPDLNSLIVLLLASIVLLVLTNRLPQLLSGIVGGASLHGMGGFGAGMIAGAATTAISSAGSVALSATAQASGGASALKAAFESAQAAMAEESGSGNGAGSSSASEDTGNVDAFGSGAGASSDSAAAGGSNGSTSGGSKGFAQSFSKAGRMASHMGSSLINGAMDYQTTNQKINSTRARQTIGEEVADHIRKRSSAQAGNREHTEFEGDSLSGSKNS
ncbi:P-type conjugative transfer protein TrbL [Salmonella enterica subsp. enterica serovar Ajiobo]|uniref:P-type conjugative transfer protein TrbL n=1 Tax=Salmonella enterica I TaxID=59201 RepID=A0A625R2Z3_SALET|nr:P-type conjugative transfer protein TrbL [Salmonella enterica subsp. enterica serovar Ajiobo]EBZ0864241.1 P-type conjugative transfer protein TrbL [Salmonella enterica subsp. enterica serovar Ajiobo]EDA0145417.1 P-type conjugative transfer protein TrbL [Salmonella enterica subsp. enterica serovar Ajiobo]EGE9216262.1 P-type conjugative transfer protein TrbL [Salmonella enterica subsp. enterica serovar Ajiobo]EHX8704278.1 P-type conjugative transfer protein TrbL [Salmonella enterica subsp. ent